MSGKHVMLSYQWDSQELVLKVYNSLTSLGYRVWMDIMGGINGGNIFACMASSVERSSAIICFMTERYETSENGERELTYAGSKKVTIIPCLVQDTREQRGCQYKPEGWLGLLTSHLLHVDFTQVEGNEMAYDEAIEKLVKQLNFYKIMPKITENEKENVRTSQPLDFPTTIVSDPILSHFSQELADTCPGPLTSLRLSIDSIPQQIIKKFRGKSDRSRSDSSSSAGQTEITRQKGGESFKSIITVTSQPDLQEQYLHLGDAPP